MPHDGTDPSTARALAALQRFDDIERALKRLAQEVDQTRAWVQTEVEELTDNITSDPDAYQTRQSNVRMLRMLRRLEWGATAKQCSCSRVGYLGSCPRCKRTEADGHSSRCELRALLRDIGGTP